MSQICRSWALEGPRAVRTYPVTPDGRYFVVRGRLWRSSNPHLSHEDKRRLTAGLMAARRAKGVAMLIEDKEGRETAKRRVHAAKVALGERGPVWWSDGSPDVNGRLAKNTQYCKWFELLDKT
jgi:hypothetical protein